MKKNNFRFSGFLVLLITGIVISGCPPIESTLQPMPTPTPETIPESFNGIVYSDESNTFYHGEWSDTGIYDIDFNYPTADLGPNSEGDYCIRADYSGAEVWGGFAFYSEPLDLHDYSNGCIKFLAKAEEPTKLYIGFESNNGAYNSVGGETTELGIYITTSWEEYVLDVNYLTNIAFTNNGVDPATIDMTNITCPFRMGNFVNSNIDFYIDDIRWAKMYTPIDISGNWTGSIFIIGDLYYDIDAILGQSGMSLSGTFTITDLGDCTITAGTIYGSYIDITAVDNSTGERISSFTGIVNSGATWMKGIYRDNYDFYEIVELNKNSARTKF